MNTDKFLKFYISVAKQAAEMSTARLSKVGAIIVKNDNIISFGYNGNLPGHDTNCEREIIVTDGTLIRELWDYLMQFPRKKEFDGDSPFYNKHFWYKEKCYVCHRIQNNNNIIFCKAKNEPLLYPSPITYSDLFYELIPKPEIISAEESALYKLAKSTESAESATMYITHAPCKSASQALISSGISVVYYNKFYNNSAIDILRNANIMVEQTKWYIL